MAASICKNNDKARDVVQRCRSPLPPLRFLREGPASETSGACARPVEGAACEGPAGRMQREVRQDHLISNNC